MCVEIHTYLNQWSFLMFLGISFGKSDTPDLFWNYKCYSNDVEKVEDWCMKERGNEETLGYYILKINIDNPIMMQNYCDPHWEIVNTSSSVDHQIKCMGGNYSIQPKVLALV